VLSLLSRNEHGDMEMSEIRRLRQLEEENGRPKKIVAQQALDLDALNFPSPDMFE